MNPPLVDLHEDLAAYILSGSLLNPFPLKPLDVDEPYRHADIPKYIASNTRLIVGAVFPMIPWYTGHGRITYRHYPSLELVFEGISLYRNLVTAHRELKLVEAKDGLTGLFEGDWNRMGLIIGLEGADPLRNPEELDLLHSAGLRVLGLTWNYSNKYASSCRAQVDNGLTREGVELVGRAVELGVVVDLAHASAKTIRDVYEVTGKPVLVSHANVKTVHDAPRNLDDKSLETIAESKGVVGLVFISPFVSSGRPGVAELVRHAVYIRDNYGVDVIAIGSDYFGSLDTPLVAGLESIDKIGNLWSSLVAEGFTPEDIEKIAWRNAVRVLSAWLK
ncbi:peptidase M19 renal dipeptidase [Desulfurococcus mucosus DSM 2162]|uniref:Peptidase M19 renal dipeptidase n=1 Tax=Desulfurococcus mucosus (strain ATCC 35584 / DSM 2162 / JCM 9187 / O7/1) TaxID=765177 RepID=E8R9R6_DESM0|nr:peptidase M19 renal dipeptidase [Desulfurococcus mucosus DSM 2162]